MSKFEEVFGELTFNKSVMKRKLSKDTYEKIIATMESGEPLDEAIACDIAHAMKEWALDAGATHFTHWFQPQRGGTAEKHDAFICYDDDGEIIERFSPERLIRSEPDASSFPSGGMRSTFEARGYTAWDPTSPAFLLESGESRTLVIPSVFLAWTGDVLDIKTPMLRSQRALNDAAIRLQRYLGNRFAKRIRVLLGPEQEYFLVPQELYNKRPDLQLCKRTLFGAPSPKGQQMEDHYFGSIKPRIMAFMADLDNELYRRGIPSKTRHNEVSPNQFEMAPLYEDANLAVDHNLQVMALLDWIAERHGLVAILHEKPFAGLNGSGKHVNWSICDNTGANYLEPSKSPLKNISFLMTIGAILLGVHRFGGLLRASVADAGNDHRLGGGEAPPGIMSVYLGKYLDELLDEIEGIGKLSVKAMEEINLGVQKLPKIAKDIADRNRTSPIAFTGNKFEFRPVGANQNCAESTTVINLIVAWGYDQIYRRLKSAQGNVKENAILILKDILGETRSIRFEGNNYSEAWRREAKERGLPVAGNTPQALRLYLEPEVKELFCKYSVLSERELISKVDIKLEAYIKTLEIEYRTAIELVNTRVRPSLTRHLKLLAETYAGLRTAEIPSRSIHDELCILEQIFEKLHAQVESLKIILTEGEKKENLFDRADYYASVGLTALDKIRQDVDRVESSVADDLWSLPRYYQMLKQ